jgi:tRNA A37 threonylcarbamoyladenosine synthetase subunit TsaC/SUA5/YrdC
MDTTPKQPAPRNQAANDARTRRSLEKSASRLTAGGWLCFPPETVPALRAVIATHDELTGWQA